MSTYISGSNQTTAQDITRLKEAYGIGAQDSTEIQTIGNKLSSQFQSIIEEFYQWLEQQPAWSIFQDSDEKVNRLKNIQVDYWKEFFTGQITPQYVENRKRIGKIHSQIGLPLPAYFSAMAKFQDIIISSLDDLSPQQSMAFNRMLLLDTGITVETFNHENNQTIADQNKAMMEMSTPITSIWEDILLLPIVGIIDSSRAQDIMDTMLSKVAELQTKFFILDISGVAVVDTAVANHIIKMTKATELMGCSCVLSGISPSIAQTMVELGINIGNLKTTSNLKDALKFAFSQTGVTIQNQQSQG